jgi:DNA-binding FrmR family transcriptional regulator
MSATDEAVTGTAIDQPEHGYTGNKDAYLRRLKRIEGQVRGIARMVDEDKYCIDILTQVSAVTKALHAVSLGLVEEHIGHCVVGAASEPDAALRAEAIDAKVKEAADAIGRLLR